MRSHTSLRNDSEANAAASHALRGATVGACKYASPAILLSLAGHVMSPVYRGLTIQFKVFLVLSGAIVGGAVEGDRRLREYEAERRKAIRGGGER
ncbi:hypothetical protein MMC10_008140 [Thelotrema lepadinum]|nr:hypothetical protein [Thelotrema lepadinum]